MKNLDDEFPRLLALHSAVFFGNVVVERAVGIEKVDYFEVVPLSDFPVVRVVGGRNLHHSRPEFLVDVAVGDYRDFLVDEGKDDLLSDKILVPLVIGIDGDGSIAEERLRARRGDLDSSRTVGKIIINMVHRTLRVDVVDLVVRKRRTAAGTPVHEILPLVHKPALVQRDENIADSLRKPLVVGKALARPVHGIPELLLLPDNRVVMLVRHFPRPFYELLAPEVVPPLAFLLERALDDVLRRDSGVVRSRNPERVVALHAVIADDDILKRVVQPVTHMKDARHVRRRNDDGVVYVLRLAESANGVVAVGIRLEISLLDPFRVDSVLEFLRVVCLL